MQPRSSRRGHGAAHLLLIGPVCKRAAIVGATAPRADVVPIPTPLSGHFGIDRYAAWRRIYPYIVEFVRAGDTTCRHGPKVS
jgi:hypothetical protein